MKLPEALKKKLTRFLPADSLQAFLNKLDIKAWQQKSRELIESLKKKPTKFLSIDFGQAFVKIVYAEPQPHNLKLIDYDFKKISSIQKDRAEVVAFINNFINKNSILEKELYLTISDPDSVIIKHLSLPALPKEEILEAARWQLKEDLPFDLENAIIDWQIGKEYTNEEGIKKNEIMLVLAEEQSLDKYISIILDCNLSPTMVSSGPFNYAHILRYSNLKDPVQAILDIGYRDTTLCIYKNKKLNFIRKLPFSSQKLTQSLTGTLVSDRGRIELSYEEAEKIKESFGIPQEETQVSKNNISAMQVISLMRPHLELLVTELKRTFDYFTSNLNEEMPTILYLTGGGNNVNNLDKYLNKELKINITKLPIPDCIDTTAIQKQAFDKDQNQIMNSLATLLADSEAINLLPQEFRTKKLEVFEKIFLRLIAITVGLVFLFSLFFVRLQVRDYKRRLSNAQAHLQTINEIKDLMQVIQARDNLINQIQKKKIPAAGLLRVISALIPRDIILNELFIDQGKHSLVLNGTVSMGREVAVSVLTGFMKSLEAASFCTEASLLSSQKINEIQTFKIKCDLTN